MNISEKLEKLGITSEDQKSIESAITDLISEAVDSKEVALKEKYELISEEYVKEQLEKKEVELTDSLNEENDEWKKELEVSLIDKFDQFLDSEIDGKISDSLLEDTAYLEIAKPIVKSIKKVYEDNHVSLDSEGSKVIAEAKDEVIKLKDDLSEAINAKMEAEKLAETGAIKLRISESVVGLSEEDSAKVKTLFEDKSFDEIDSKIDNYVSILAEETLKEENNAGKDEVETTTELESDDNGLDDEKQLNESVNTVNSLAEKYI